MTFTVNGTTVSTTASTRFDDETCAALTSGTTVIVDGTMQNGAVTAVEVRSQVPVVHLRGTVSGLQAACPIVTFTVDTTTVTTAANTKFAGGTCAQLANGTIVDVDGTLQNGSVVATTIQSAVPNQVSVVDVRGTVSGLQGACPLVTFTVDQTAVSTTAKTRFDGEACARIANGANVIVEGTLQNGTIVATDVAPR